jgi:hypothetical protein
MRRAFGTLVLVIVGLFFAYTAWSSGTAPTKFAAQLGLSILNADGFNEIRAQYAGFFLTCAAVCAASLGGVVSRQTAYIIVAVTSGGCIGGRLISLMLDGGIAGYSPTIVALYFIDGTVLAMSLTALAVDRRTQLN